MNFNNYIQKRLSIGGSNPLSFGSLTGSSLDERLKNISLFSSASLDQLNSLDLAKLLEGEVNENASAEEQALGDIVSALMELEGVQDTADINGDGQVDEAEAQEFLKSIMRNDDDMTNFSFADIDKAMENLGINLEKAAENAVTDALQPNEELPVLVYLHGLGEVGKGEQGMYSAHGPGGIVPDWDLANFNGYIICPQLSSGNWSNANAENNLRQLMDSFQETHNTGKSVIMGASLGGSGATYMANHMGSEYVDEAVILSGYSGGVNDIQIPVTG